MIEKMLSTKDGVVAIGRLSDLEVLSENEKVGEMVLNLKYLEQAMETLKDIGREEVRLKVFRSPDELQKEAGVLSLSTRYPKDMDKTSVFIAGINEKLKEDEVIE